MHRCPSAVRSFIALFILAAAAAIPAGAASVRRLELDEVRSRAEAVFAGEVVGITARVSGDGKMVWTDYEIEVSETLAGRNPGARTTLSFGGGTVPGLSIGIPGMPKLNEGEHYVFFIEPRLDASKPAFMPTVGWSQGLYRIVRVDGSENARTALVSADGETLEISSDGRLTRGAVVNIVEGRIVETQTPVREGVGIRVRPTSVENPDGTVTPFVATPRTEQATVRAARNLATFDDLRLFAQQRLDAAPSRNR